MKYFKSLWILLIFAFLGFAPGCMHPLDSGLGSQTAAVVYDKIDHIDVEKHSNQALKKMSDSVAMVAYPGQLRVDSKTGKHTIRWSYTLHTRVKNDNDFGGKLLCADEPLRNKLAPAYSCTSFLIGPRLMATSASCILEKKVVNAADVQFWCIQTKVIFGIKSNASGNMREVNKDDVYQCRRVLTHQFDYKSSRRDFVVFELDRDVKDRKPLPLDKNPTLKQGDKIVSIGHPLGMLLKITTGQVTEPRSATKDYFVSDLDGGWGAAGSPVISLSSMKVVGLRSVIEKPDFVVDSKNACLRVRRATQKEAIERSNYIKVADGPSCRGSSSCARDQLCEQGKCVYRTPDLQIVDFQMSPKSGPVGTTVTVKYTFINKGNLPVAMPFRVGLWRSENSDICPNCGLDKEVTSKMFLFGAQVGQRHSGQFSFKLTSEMAAEKQYFGLYLDDYYLHPTKPEPLTYGSVPELDESNNEKAELFTVGGCQSNCPGENQRRCNGQAIEICQKNQAGCFTWQASKTCVSPLLCSAGKCQPGCKNACTNGEKRCSGNVVQSCQVQQNGCYQWKTLQTCQEGDTCQKAQCQAKQPPKDKTKPEENGCKNHTDCKQGQICSAGKCQAEATRPPPAGSCRQKSDCSADENCLNGTCTPMQRDEGCACSATPGVTPSGPGALGFLFLLLLFAQILRKRRMYRFFVMWKAAKDMKEELS